MRANDVPASINTTRRGVIAALALAPLASAPVLAAPADQEFQRLLAEYHAVRHRLDSHPWGSTSFNDPRIAELERQMKALGNETDQALERILLHPSVSPADAATKLEVLIAEYEGSVFDEERLLPIINDLRRLAA